MYVLMIYIIYRIWVWFYLCIWISCFGCCYWEIKEVGDKLIIFEFRDVGECEREVVRSWFECEEVGY